MSQFLFWVASIFFGITFFVIWPDTETVFQEIECCLFIISSLLLIVICYLIKIYDLLQERNRNEKSKMEKNSLFL